MIYAMEPQALAKRIALLSKIDTAKAEPAPDTSVAGYEVVDGVAIIPVRGALADSRSWLDELLGGGPVLTYSEMAAALLDAADDPDVREILLDVDSPGGEVAGLSRTVEAVQLARIAKPVTARVGGMAASAAYWIASQAERIVAEGELAQVGSIGVAAAVWLPDGVVQIASTAAPRKRPDVSTDEGRAMIRDELDAIHVVFARQVAEGRGTTVEAVNANYGQGGLLLAAEAARRGMIDGLEKRNTGVAGSAEESAIENRKGGDDMTLEQIKAENPEIAQGLRDEGIQAERKRVAQLTAWKGINADADKAVEEAVAAGKTYDDVASILASAVARGNSVNANGDNAPNVTTGAALNAGGVTEGLDDTDVKAAKLFGMSLDDYRKYSPKEDK